MGDANRFAHAAALTVAELPGQAYNPLFIYGPPGVGKTHLLHSIGNYVLAYGGGLTVRYTTVETFTNEFLAALHRNDMDALQGPLPPRRRPAHRRRPVPRVQGQDRGGVLPHLQRAARRRQPARPHLRPPPARPRRARGPPARALRGRPRHRHRAARPPHAPAVLRKRAQHDGVDLADDGVLDLLAERAPHNVRALEGALIRVVAFASLTSRPITTDLAADVLADLYPAAGAAAARAPYRRGHPGAHRRGLRPHP